VESKVCGAISRVEPSCNLAEAGKRRFSDYCTEATLLFYSLKQDGSTHRLAYSKNALGALVHDQPVKPATYIVTLLYAVGREIASTFTLSA
jgi:hypothetical protein